MASQSGVPSSYPKNTYFGSSYEAIEMQSADFLEKYISGEIVLEPECYETMELYLSVLGKSKYHAIKSILKKANKKFKIEVISKRKEEEKKAAILKSQFSILSNKKKAMQLSSSDFLMIGEMLDGVTEYSTKKIKDKLSSLIQEKIKRTYGGEFETDKDFDKLVKQYGSYQQQRRYDSFKKNQDEVKKANAVNKDKKILSLKNRLNFSFLKKGLHKVKRVAVVAGIAVLGYFGTKFVYNEFGKKSDSPEKTPTETLMNKQEQKVSDTKVFKEFENGAVLQKTKVDKTPERQKLQEVSEAKQVINAQSSENAQQFKQKSTKSNSQSAEGSLEKAYKNRFDSSLKILIGEKARDVLYSKVDQLHKQGKIRYSAGTTREWYAHAFTMYAKIVPYSKENKAIQSLLSGQNIDADYVNNLVLSAKRNGTGVRGDGLYSAFDHSSKELQKEHIQNVKNIQKIQRVMQTAYLER